MKTVACSACVGTGLVIEWEKYESVVNSNDSLVEYAERHGRTIVSLDVEGSYPSAIVLGLIYHDETPIEAVERELSSWPMGADDRPTSPRNVIHGSVYEPVDPRFYGET